MTRKYHLSAIFLSIFLMAALCITPALASGSETEETVYSAENMEYIDHIVQFKHCIRVHDAQGVDITSQFYENLEEYYENRDYTQIFDMLLEQDLTVTELKKEASNYSATPRMTFTYNVSKSQEIPLIGMSGSLNRNAIVTVTGQYTVNDYNASVSSASAPTLVSATAGAGEVRVRLGSSSASYTASRATFKYVCSGDYFTSSIPGPAGYFDTTTITFYGYP